jgi:hypothetical protein
MIVTAIADRCAPPMPSAVGTHPAMIALASSEWGEVCAPCLHNRFVQRRTLSTQDVGLVHSQELWAAGDLSEQPVTEFT